jgi:hypothetical protein
LAERRVTEDRIDTVRETVKFLRKSATELRQTATNELDLAQTLHDMADQCEATAKEFAEHYGVDGLRRQARGQAGVKAAVKKVNVIGFWLPELQEIAGCWIGIV